MMPLKSLPFPFVPTVGAQRYLIGPVQSAVFIKDVK